MTGLDEKAILGFIDGIVDKYVRAQRTVIHEYSGDISGDTKALNREAKYLKREARAIVSAMSNPGPDVIRAIHEVVNHLHAIAQVEYLEDSGGYEEEAKNLAASMRLVEKWLGED
jgi:hypothetical protein